MPTAATSNEASSRCLGRFFPASARSQSATSASSTPKMPECGTAQGTAHRIKPLPLDDPLMATVMRVSHLEAVVRAQQTQLNELVPLQRDILAAHSLLCRQQALVAREQAALRQSHEALCTRHDTLGIRHAALLQDLMEFGWCRLSKDEESFLCQSNDVSFDGGRTEALKVLPEEAETDIDEDPSLALASNREGSGLSSFCLETEPQSIMEDTTASFSATDTTASFTHTASFTPLDDPRLELCLAGGHFCTGFTDEVVSAVECFSAASGRWEHLAPMTSVRSQHKLAVTDGSVIVVGGRSRDSYLASCERLRLGSHSWEALPCMSVARGGHALAVLNGLVYVTGGTSDGTTLLAHCERLDTEATGWDLMPAMSAARKGHTMVMLNESLFVVSGNKEQSEAVCECLGPVADQWWPLPPMTSTSWRTLNAAGVAEKLYVIGSSSLKRVPATFERYDPRTGQWEAMSCNERLLTCTALTEAMGSLYVFGGRCCQSFSPGTGKWKQLTPMPNECSPYQALTVRGRIYVISKSNNPEAGSSSSFGNSSTAAMRFDPVIGTWTVLPPPSHLGCEAVVLTSA
mmetsp:Transcript_81829/g.162442  ORF Transcript_81829/g.162442 Transcript_81829/m.162442 type:complete len:575 (+) Transcript_81829:87-1811(+)